MKIKIWTIRLQKFYNWAEKFLKSVRRRVIAEMLDISREHLAKIETAKRCISLGLLIDIADKLGVQVRDLIDF